MEVAQAIESYLSLRSRVEGALLKTKQGRRMRAQGLAVLYGRLGKRAGVKGVHPHRFRHTFAKMANPGGGQGDRRAALARSR